MATTKNCLVYIVETQYAPDDPFVLSGVFLDLTLCQRREREIRAEDPDLVIRVRHEVAQLQLKRGVPCMQ